MVNRCAAKKARQTCPGTVWPVRMVNAVLRGQWFEGSGSCDSVKQLTSG